MSVQDAEPGDIYADASGKLWRILSVIHEPTVEAEEIEGVLDDPNAPRMDYPAPVVGGFVLQGFVQRASIRKMLRKAPTGADVWAGFQRIWRRSA